jgi:hypothetical protein
MRCLMAGYVGVDSGLTLFAASTSRTYYDFPFISLRVWLSLVRLLVRCAMVVRSWLTYEYLV